MTKEIYCDFDSVKCNISIESLFPVLLIRTWHFMYFMEKKKNLEILS